MSAQHTPGSREVTFGWFVTSPNPRSPTTGYDAGQRGWRLHAVLLNGGEPSKGVERRPALCGLRPRHGWGADLFIDTECGRCSDAMARRVAAGDVFVDLPAKIYAEHQARRAAEEAAEDAAIAKAAGSPS